MFFDYVRKDDCGDYLPDIVKSACSRDGLERHLPAMLRKIASELKILDKRFPDGHLGTLATDMAKSASAKTVDDLIGALISGDRPYLDKMGKEVLAIIRSTATDRWP